MKPSPYFNSSPAKRMALTSLLAATYLASYAHAQQYFQAPYGPGGTWRVYEINPGQTLSWREAHDLAQSKTFPTPGGVRGHLFSLNSEAKSLFIRRNLNWSAGEVWVGLTDREGVLALEDGEEDAQESQTFGTADDANRINGWKFTNKDPYGDYMRWNPGEPNNAANGEDAVHMNPSGGWNDNESGYGPEEPTSPVLQGPETSGDETQGEDRRFAYIIEYSVNSPTPLPGVRHGAVIPPGSNFNLPLSTAGNWSVRVFRDLTTAGNVIDAVDQVLAGAGTIEDAQIPIIDLADLDNSPAGGPILTSDPIPFPGDQPGDTDHMLLVAKARVSVATPGDYTIQVRSDDGFVLRFPGRNWSGAAGAGYIDPLDPSALVYELGTGDANTRGVISLPAGEHDVEFVYWEGVGGAYCEITSASGNRLNPGEARWLPLGSSETLPELNTINAVHMLAPATVANVNFARESSRSNNLPALRKLMDFLIDEGVAVTETRGWLEIPEADMPGNPGEGDWDYYFTKVTGRFTVDADANGNGTNNEQVDVTFGIFCDDGCSLRIKGQDFTKVSNFTATTLVDNEGDMTLTADFPTGNSNAYGLVRLEEGKTYEFEAWMYELAGGSNFNLRWQFGDKTATGFTDNEQVVLSDSGDVISLDEPATVTTAPNHLITIPYMDRAVVMANEAVAQNLATTGQAETLIIRDSVDGGTVTGTPYAGTNTVFPVGGTDHYLTKVFGRLKVDNQNGTPGESLTVTFCMFSDDGSAFRIVGQDFISAGDAGLNNDAGSSGAVLGDIGGDQAMVADLLTGNADAIGTIILTEGEYDFEGYHFESEGGSMYEVWWALGEHDAFDGTVFRPLNNNPGQLFPANTGLPLVAGVATPPAGETFAITSFSFDPSSGAFSVVFDSETGANYALDYTIGFLPSGAAAATNWNTAPGFTSVPSAGASTTINGNISALLAPGGTMPDGSRCFFRVRKL